MMRMEGHSLAPVVGTWRWHWLLVCGLILLFSLFCGFAFGVAGLVLSNLSPHYSSTAAGMPQISIDCRIISSGVDLRTTKICEALDNGQMQSRFRCYFEYYWASVFRVEFKPHASELVVQAVTEVPREALPPHCRPGFGRVWMVKESHQVNGTYPCKYTLGSLTTVEISEDFFPHCRSEDISVFKLIKQACYMLIFSEQWFFSIASEAAVFFQNYIFVAALYSVFVIGFTKIISKLRLMLSGPNQFSNGKVVYFEARFQIKCMIAAVMLYGIWCTGHPGGSNSIIRGRPFEDINRTLFGVLKALIEHCLNLFTGLFGLLKSSM